MFKKYQHAILSYSGNPCDSNLLIGNEGKLAVYYSPFEWLNTKAKVVIVGITPGRVQANNALVEAKRCLQAGLSDNETLRLAKQTGAFSGKMRPNLVALLDSIKLNNWLQIGSCSELFSGKQELLQTASVLQFPVFLDDENYNGTPDLLKSQLLKGLLTEHFGQMTKSLPDAVYIPLGPVPTKAMSWLANQGYLSNERVLAGLPHPSGANAERIAYFLGQKSKTDLSVKTDPVKLDAARESLLAAVSML